MHGTLSTFYIAFNKHTKYNYWMGKKKKEKDGLARPAISTCPIPQTPTCNSRHNLLQI